MLLRPLVTALVALCATTAIFVEAFHAPWPNGVPIGVVGAPATAAEIQRALDQASPGAFEVRGYATQDQARYGLTHADIRGVLTVGLHGDHALVAQAYGLSETQAVTTAFDMVASRADTPLRVSDAVPLPAQDRSGLSVNFTILATLLPSLAFGGALALLAAQRAWWRRWGAIIAYALLAALVITFNVDLITGALTESFLGITLVGGLFALAVAATAHGVTRLAGKAGLAAAIILLVIVGLPFSGGPITHELQPGFYATMSQWWPNGAALTALRNVVYFHWAGTTMAFVVLGGWALAGLGLGFVGERLAASHETHGPSSSRTHRRRSPSKFAGLLRSD